jgi:hypothetical protein
MYFEALRGFALGRIGREDVAEFNDSRRLRKCTNRYRNESSRTPANYVFRFQFLPPFGYAIINISCYLLCNESTNPLCDKTSFLANAAIANEQFAAFGIRYRCSEPS